MNSELNADPSVPIPRLGRPHLFINMAMTADGKIATAGREVTTFGSPRDLQHLYELRATADAILCGARTLEETGATLGNGGDKYRRKRLAMGLAEYPLRVIVTGRGSISPEAAIWKNNLPSPIVVLNTQLITAECKAWLKEHASAVDVSESDEIDFESAIRRLNAQFGVQRIVSEGGAELNAALFRAGLVDEIHLTVCPYIFGGRGAPTIAEGIGIEHLADANEFELVQRRQVGTEMFLVYRRPGKEARSPSPVAP